MMRNIIRDYKNVLIIGLIAIGIGLLVGAIDALFGRVLLVITEFRDDYNKILIPFLAVAGALIIFIYNKLGKNSIKGMSLIFSAGFNEDNIIPKRLIPLIIVSTWITHLFGGSAGREGVAVQIGGAVSHNIGRKINLKDSNKIFLVAGMAAGFAGLFQTPVAAIFFAMEVMIVGSLEYGALFPSIIAAFTASYTSHALGLEKFSVHLGAAPNITIYLIVKIIILGILFGIVGGIFAHCLNDIKMIISKKLENPYLRITVIGCLLSILLLIFHQGRYSGLGTNIIMESFWGGDIYWYDWILKAALTIITLSAGFQGGEVTPLFSIGSSLGVIVASLFGLPVEFTAALGYAAIFGSATNTILAPIFIGVEVFGYDYLP